MAMFKGTSHLAIILTRFSPLPKKVKVIGASLCPHTKLRIAGLFRELVLLQRLPRWLEFSFFHLLGVHADPIDEIRVTNLRGDA
jgi:hypothetical protein